MEIALRTSESPAEHIGRSVLTSVEEFLRGMHILFANRDKQYGDRSMKQRTRKKGVTKSQRTKSRDEKRRLHRKRGFLSD